MKAVWPESRWSRTHREPWIITRTHGVGSTRRNHITPPRYERGDLGVQCAPVAIADTSEPTRRRNRNSKIPFAVRGSVSGPERSVPVNVGKNNTRADFGEQLRHLEAEARCGTRDPRACRRGRTRVRNGCLFVECLPSFN